MRISSFLSSLEIVRLVGKIVHLALSRFDLISMKILIYPQVSLQLKLCNPLKHQPPVSGRCIFARAVNHTEPSKPLSGGVQLARMNAGG